MMSSGSSILADENEIIMSRSRNSFDIEAHPSELAIIVKSGLRKEQKIIYLKDLTASVDAAVVARFVLDKCPNIPSNKAADVEQVIHYLQKRNPTSLNLHSDIPKTTTNVAAFTSRLEDIESYIELLYEETEKTKGTAYILSLSSKPSNLQRLIDNDVLMAALTRVFREDSKKNFELATNIAVIFLRLSSIKSLQTVISHYKIGALSMQLIENELKRWEIWKNEAKTSIEVKAKKKWEFAIQRQDELVSVLLQILINLADDLRVENKMVKRGILTILIKCLDHGTPNLMVSAITFLWKLSVFVENKDAMLTQNIIEKLVPLFPTNNLKLTNCLYSLLFNLSFDQSLRTKMVANGLVPFVAPAIEHNSTALCLLYHLSTIDDAKAMITFTDAISSLMKMLNSKDNLIVKGILVNVALEKRNSQLICSSDGRGLDTLITKAFENYDILLMKICRNIASHEGATQELFQKHLIQLLKFVMEECDDTKAKTFPFAIECLGTVAQINIVDWPKIIAEIDLISWISTHFEVANAVTPALPKIPDDFLLQIIILCGSIALNQEAAKLLIKIVPQMTKLILKKQNDDEIVLQIIYAFYCLLYHSELTSDLCSIEGGFVEYLINLMHDSNPQLRNMCDQALQFIAESSPYWAKRLNEERFRFHNSQWLEMCEEGQGEIENLSDSESEEFNDVVLGAEELLLEDIKI
uniref:Kinesin-associated protein n=1 Tax=Panagrolaimus superbus TaxID=310955 RepID=A0A914ZHC8_9BILA